jgi:CspA family cold shock protein
LAQGIVKWFNDRKGYGFISQEDGNDVFVHYSAIEAQGFKTLAEGDRVDFEIQETDRGPEAKSVKKL